MFLKNTAVANVVVQLPPIIKAARKYLADLAAYGVTEDIPSPDFIRSTNGPVQLSVKAPGTRLLLPNYTREAGVLCRDLFRSTPPPVNL